MRLVHHTRNIDLAVADQLTAVQLELRRLLRVQHRSRVRAAARGHGQLEYRQDTLRLRGVAAVGLNVDILVHAHLAARDIELRVGIRGIGRCRVVVLDFEQIDSDAQRRGLHDGSRIHLVVRGDVERGEVIISASQLHIRTEHVVALRDGIHQGQRRGRKDGLAVVRGHLVLAVVDGVQGHLLAGCL